ncbi:hypothetical protein HMPREF0972_00405 [Actinomyces sp. oral taxon 848 str. F0332]|nr:hypothetical protein HMPREF0972_00405 [Actinomyces sp. oral taxon 848 str. F0332]
MREPYASAHPDRTEGSVSCFTKSLAEKRHILEAIILQFLENYKTINRPNP